MAPPPRSNGAPAPARSSGTSVARSLAQAAAALRAQDFSVSAHPTVRDAEDANDTRRGAYGPRSDGAAALAARRQAPRYTHYAAEQQAPLYQHEENDGERGATAMYDREAFYAELRERHRNLTHRQRLAREFYEQLQWRQQQQQQQQQYQVQRREETVYGQQDDYEVQDAAKRRRVLMDTRAQQFRRQQQQQDEAAAAARHSSYPPQLGASVDRRVRESRPLAEVGAGRIGLMEQQRGQMQVQMRAASTGGRPLSAGLGPRVTSPLRAHRPAPVQVPDVRTMGPPPTVTSGKSPSGAGTPTSNGPVENKDNNALSVIEDPDDDDDDEDAAVVEDDTPGEDKKPKKRVRYLGDTDRRNIIKRIENGEKQAALAREFGVTRAAICHIKNNRFEILSRYDMLVKSAQEMDRAEIFVGPPGVDMMVHEVRANSVLLLMTMLRDNRSNGATFRRVAGRLIMILLEEALAVLGTESVEVRTGTGHLYRGLERKHQYCGVAIGAEGFPFLVLFHQMEPEAPQGSIHVTKAVDRRGQRAWLLDHMDLPANIVHHRVLLFSATCSTGDAECKAIEALCSVGCDERTISLVVILIAGDGIVKISNRFPHVKIITSGVDDKVDPHTDGIIPGFGDFVSRYNDS
ncbi:hypothetical protein PF002_g1877 [Phytophthora fragariae]|uniref:Uncharacterized protein n=1 Tax=Phytophthora fragariae TaxID=53985 RepID=A0A6A3TPE5_9STRA|nr:hypothetical protein PF007_g1544 [Phytophthora fragariae]KAE9256365.1 hypothetical protein PF002_g1877 [Phytophthora fragariae]KAE9328502.1 hypothetical protein PF001_g1344 [Phytophthora fragariae]